MLMRVFRAAFHGVRQTLITRITWGYREFEMASNAFEFHFEAFVLCPLYSRLYIPQYSYFLTPFQHFFVIVEFYFR